MKQWEYSCVELNAIKISDQTEHAESAQVKIFRTSIFADLQADFLQISLNYSDSQLE